MRGVVLQQSHGIANDRISGGMPPRRGIDASSIEPGPEGRHGQQIKQSVENNTLAWSVSRNLGRDQIDDGRGDIGAVEDCDRRKGGQQAHAEGPDVFVGAEDHHGAPGRIVAPGPDTAHQRLFHRAAEEVFAVLAGVHDDVGFGLRLVAEDIRLWPPQDRDLPFMKRYGLVACGDPHGSGHDGGDGERCSVLHTDRPRWGHHHPQEKGFTGLRSLEQPGQRIHDDNLDDRV